MTAHSSAVPPLTTHIARPGTRHPKPDTHDPTRPTPEEFPHV